MDIMQHSRSSISAQRIADPRINFSYFFMVCGAGCIALSLYVFPKWITGPYFKTVPTGPDIPPPWMRIVADFIEAFTIACFVVVAYKVIYKSWRRTGKLSSDALMVLACLTFYWQDCLPDYFVAETTLLTSVFHNWGSWYMYIPGWMSPGIENLPEAPLAWALSYPTWFVFLPMILGAKMVGRIRERFPDLTPTELLACAWLVFAVIDVALEGAFLRTGMYAYGTSIPSLTLWAGKPHQFPMVEMIGWGFAWAMWATSYYYRDDKGYTWVERGVQTLRLGEGMKSFLRFLALAGFFNMGMLMFSSIPLALNGLLGGRMVQGHPSYLNHLCGPDTPYDCPAPDVLIPRRGTPTNRIGSN
jgi:hypothetical protein